MQNRKNIFKIKPLKELGITEGEYMNYELHFQDKLDEGYQIGLAAGREEGKEEGREEGLAKGLAEGLEEGKISIIKTLLKYHNDEDLAKMIDFPLHVIKKLRTESNN